ncbi:MAG: type IV pilus secretin PilQ family protein [Porticoccaceae bacterium]|nr:type IV pilus secretin PilQ family protein [Porticoccaceae bacterium]
MIFSVVLFETAFAATVDDIGFSALPGGRFEIKLSAVGGLPEPKSYAIDSPARIVLEFEDTTSALQKKKYPLAFDNAQSVVVLSAGGKTRLIVNLKDPVGFETFQDDGGIRLHIGDFGGASFVQKEEAPVFELPTTPSDTSAAAESRKTITDVDFRRGEKGEGLVSIGLEDANTTVDVSQVGQNIVLSFYRTALPEALNRKLDVVDFATPISTIDTKTDGGMTKMVISATGEYDYLAYQVDGQYIISVKRPTQEELEVRKSRFEFTGEKLSLNFQDIEVRSVLQLIADFTDLNLVASDTVVGNITLRLRNVPWDQALEIVLKSKGLDKRQEGNVLLVAPAVEIAERERLQVEANKQLVELAPMVTEFVRIKYADARELFELFNTDGDGGSGGNDDDDTATSSILSERGSAIVDERTNTIILTDVQDKIDDFYRLIKVIDIPVRQVEIEARIIVASTDFKKEVGTRWGIAGSRTPGGNVFEFSGQRVGLDSDPGSPAEFFGDFPAESPALDLAETLGVDLGVSNPTGSLALGLLTNNTLIDLELSALENDGFGEILSQPKLLTGDKQKAVIKAGTEIAYESGTSSGETDIEFREAVLMLEVTPQITPDNRVIMDLHITQDTIGENVPTSSGGSEPTIDITEITTKVLVGDGQTLVLGGIFQMTEVKGVEKVPVLGDIPYLGRLFRKDSTEHTKREILIFITPKIISDPLLDR